ncbi:MAG: RagB/SusD family nutrient uptake outer membrane protein [Cyclobacteriaceae bacterium]
MKTYKYIFLSGLLILMSCGDFLDEEVYTEINPETFLQSEEGLDALLVGAYASLQVTTWDAVGYYYALGEFSTDMSWETGGGLNRRVLPLMEFSWDPSTDYFNQYYSRFYEAIAAANNVLLVTGELTSVDQSILNKTIAEARFIRGTAYYLLHNLFGPTPIVEIPAGASLDEIEAAGKGSRATEDEYRMQVESDLMFAVDNLEYGGSSSRANKGSAYAVLTKYYLNNKQWSDAASAAENVINNGGYALYPNYLDLFSVVGENNTEFVFRFDCLVGSNQQNTYISHAFPPNYPIQTNWANFGAQFRTYTAFFETFDDTDSRRQLLIHEYTPTTTNELTPLDRDTDGNALDDVRSFKFFPDPNAVGAFHGNDIPLIRYADILLARAEALNESNGPAQESIDLINEVRSRANSDASFRVSLADFGTKESLRDFILAERGREFYSEGLRREDLIRHGSYIEQAVNRGKLAQAHHVLFPIPQAQRDNNPDLGQNDGYQ